jgi:putative ABC transport system permease protein
MNSFIFDIESWQEIFESIRKNKLRTSITILGVLWGIFLLVSLLGAARGMGNKFNVLFNSFATNSVFIWGQSTSLPFKGFKEGRPIKLKLANVEQIKQEIKGLDFVIPRNISQSVVSRNFASFTTGIFGDDPMINKIQALNMLAGRFINELDNQEKKKVCVIEENIYKQFFQAQENPIGQYIEINGSMYLVIGLYRKDPARSGGPNGEIHIPFNTFQNIYNQGGKIGWLMVTGKLGYDTKQLEFDIKLLLKNLHQVHPEDNRAFGSFNLGNELKKVQGFLIGMQFLTWFVGVATLIAGVVAIGNILLITVKERTREIGIRRALGAKPSDIIRQIVLESVFLTTIAGILGIIFGGAVLMAIDTFWGQNESAVLVNPTVNIPIILIALLLLIVLGSLIGLIPALMAIKIKPIEALKED